MWDAGCYDAEPRNPYPANIATSYYNIPSELTVRDAEPRIPHPANVDLIHRMPCSDNIFTYGNGRYLAEAGYSLASHTPNPLGLGGVVCETKAGARAQVWDRRSSMHVATYSCWQVVLALQPTNVGA